MIEIIEIYVSNLTIRDFGVETDLYGVEEQVDQLIFMAMQAEFFGLDVRATSGNYDQITMWNDDGDQVDPATIDAQIRVADALNTIDWSQVEYAD